MQRALAAGLSGLLVLAFALSVSVAQADGPAAAQPAAPPATTPSDFDIAQGHFYKQGAGSVKDQPNAGFSISDDGGIPLWSEFERLGGVDALGYPVSGRFILNGSIVQLTQKVGLVWHPEAGQVRFLNVFHLLHDGGKDAWLLTKGIPPEAAWTDEAGKTWSDISQKRYKLLDTNSAIKTAYFGIFDPVNMYGLPTSNWLDTPVSSVLRFENVVFQQWKQPLPWASPGQVQMANGGDLLKESGILGPAPFVPQNVPPPMIQAVPAGLAVISFYSDAFQGAYTSSGAMFSQNKMMAASNAFPLGTRLRLTTLDGKHSIIVVNDDRPPAWNQRIDLSKAAFQALYPLSSGLGTVKVELIQ